MSLFLYAVFWLMLQINLLDFADLVQKYKKDNCMLFIILSMTVILGSISAFTFYIMSKNDKHERHTHL